MATVVEDRIVDVLGGTAKTPKHTSGSSCPRSQLVLFGSEPTAMERCRAHLSVGVFCPDC